LVTDLIQKAPLQYRLQLAALNYHLRLQKTKERILRERARDIMNKYAQKTIAVNGKVFFRTRRFFFNDIVRRAN